MGKSKESQNDNVNVSSKSEESDTTLWSNLGGPPTDNLCNYILPEMNVNNSNILKFPSPNRKSRRSHQKRKHQPKKESSFVMDEMKNLKLILMCSDSELSQDARKKKTRFLKYLKLNKMDVESKNEKNYRSTSRRSRKQRSRRKVLSASSTGSLNHHKHSDVSKLKDYFSQLTRTARESGHYSNVNKLNDVASSPSSDGRHKKNRRSKTYDKSPKKNDSKKRRSKSKKSTSKPSPQVTYNELLSIVHKVHKPEKADHRSDHKKERSRKKKVNKQITEKRKSAEELISKITKKSSTETGAFNPSTDNKTNGQIIYKFEKDNKPYQMLQFENDVTLIKPENVNVSDELLENHITKNISSDTKKFIARELFENDMKLTETSTKINITLDDMNKETTSGETKKLVTNHEKLFQSFHEDDDSLKTCAKDTSAFNSTEILSKETSQFDTISLRQSIPQKTGKKTKKREDSTENDESSFDTNYLEYIDRDEKETNITESSGEVTPRFQIINSELVEMPKNISDNSSTNDLEEKTLTDVAGGDVTSEKTNMELTQMESTETETYEYHVEFQSIPLDTDSDMQQQEQLIRSPLEEPDISHENALERRVMVEAEKSSYTKSADYADFYEYNLSIEKGGEAEINFNSKKNSEGKRGESIYTKRSSLECDRKLNDGLFTTKDRVKLRRNRSTPSLDSSMTGDKFMEIIEKQKIPKPPKMSHSHKRSKPAPTLRRIDNNLPTEQGEGDLKLIYYLPTNAQERAGIKDKKLDRNITKNNKPISSSQEHSSTITKDRRRESSIIFYSSKYIESKSTLKSPSQSSINPSLLGVPQSRRRRRSNSSGQQRMRDHFTSITQDASSTLQQNSTLRRTSLGGSSHELKKSFAVQKDMQKIPSKPSNVKASGNAFHYAAGSHLRRNVPLTATGGSSIVGGSINNSSHHQQRMRTSSPAMSQKTGGSPYVDRRRTASTQDKMKGSVSKPYVTVTHKPSTHTARSSVSHVVARQSSPGRPSSAKVASPKITSSRPSSPKVATPKVVSPRSSAQKTAPKINRASSAKSTGKSPEVSRAPSLTPSKVTEKSGNRNPSSQSKTLKAPPKTKAGAKKDGNGGGDFPETIIVNQEILANHYGRIWVRYARNLFDITAFMFSIIFLIWLYSGYSIIFPILVILLAFSKYHQVEVARLPTILVGIKLVGTLYLDFFNGRLPLPEPCP